MKLPKLLRWTRGRQKDSTYWIFPIFRVLIPILKLFEAPRSLGVDSYIIYYPIGSSIGWHRDPNPRGDHYRVNIELWRGQGGEFLCGETIYSNGRIHFFRPDINLHRVTEVTKGRRVVFSVGWVYGKRWGQTENKPVAPEELGRWESEGGRVS